MIKKFYKNRLLHETIFYGLATAINRGLILLALPFLGAYLTIDEYGVWSLSQILISLGAPIISLNGAVAILREGAEDKNTGHVLYRKFALLTALVSTVLLLTTLLAMQTDWVFYTLILIVIEAFLSLLTSWYRANDRHLLYLAAVCTKLIALFASIWLLVGMDNLSLTRLLQYQAIFGCVLLMPFYIQSMIPKIGTQLIGFKNMLIFSIALIPHGLSQWILSGSDRLIIKSVLGDFQLGFYSLAYSLAMVIMLINSGLGMTIPVDMIKNYDQWANSKRRTASIFLFSLVFLFASISIMLGSILLKPHVAFLKDLNPLVLAMLPWITGGMYFVGLYIFYINYLFYHRKSMLVSTLTTVAAVFSIICTFILVKMIGVEGAAISTFFSYLFYLCLSIGAACKYAQVPWKTCLIDVLIITITSGVNYLILNFVSYQFIEQVS